LYDPEETQPMTVPNQELFSKIPPQLLVVSQRSQTITVQNKEVVFIARRVSSKGDNLVLDKMGVSLCVPPGAIKDGELKTIVLVLNWDLSDNPNMTEKQALVSPVVYVGPHDLKLEKQCTLCFKHCSFDTRQIKIMKSETELTESKEWNEYCNVEDDTGLCVLTPDECQLRIDTFTLYTCLQSPTDTEDCRKWLQVAAFSMPLKSNINHQQVRINVREYRMGNKKVNNPEKLVHKTKESKPKTHHKTSSVLSCSLKVRYIMASIPERVNPKTIEISTCFMSTKYASIRNKNKNCSVHQCQDYVSE
jgi:hypothetical protein